MNTHCSEFYFHKNHCHHHEDRKQCVEVIGNCMYKQGNSILSFYKSADCRSPWRNRCNDTYRCCCGIDQVRQLCAGHIVLICHRTHNASYCQTVKIIVNKDQYTKNDGWEFRTNSAFNPLTGPASECCGTACPVHQTYHGSQNNKEDQDTHIIRICQNADHSAFKNMKDCSFEIKIRVKQCTNQYSYKQWTVYFFGDQCQCNGNKRRNQRPECAVKFRRCSHLFLCCKYSQRTCQYQQHQCWKAERKSFYVTFHFFSPSLVRYMIFRS